MCYGADRLAPPSVPAAKRKKARCEKNRLHNASQPSRPASLLSSPTDYARRSITTASTTDFDGSQQTLGRGARWAGFDNTIVGTLQTATRLRRHHLLHSTGRRSAAGSGRLQGCCARGARRPRQHYLLHSTSRSPAAGSGRLQGCGAREARRPRLHRDFPPHSAGRRPAAVSCRLPGCGAPRRIHFLHTQVYCADINI